MKTRRRKDKSRRTPAVHESAGNIHQLRIYLSDDRYERLYVEMGRSRIKNASVAIGQLIDRFLPPDTQKPVLSPPD